MQGRAIDWGRHFLIGLQKSPTLTEHDRRLLAELRPAGVVLFRDNFDHEPPYPDWLDPLRALLDQAREAIGRDRIVVAVDHEGGQVIRTPAPVTDFGEAASWASQAAQVGSGMGRELASLGINVNFAPVVDVHSNPANPVIGSRALGTDPRSVIRAARSFLRAQQAEGVLGCLKHYPGHGDTAVDSHEALPVVDRSLESLRRRELAPFLELLDETVELVMTAHVHYPQWDPEWPATLSRRIVEETLRHRAGYEGVVTTDDLGMRAISERFDEPGIPARALTAGCDWLTVCAHLTDTGRALGMARSLARSHAEGELADEVVRRSRRRIERLLASLPQHPVRELPPETFAEHRLGAQAG